MSHPGLLATVALFVALPIAIWISRRTSDALHRHDAGLDQLDFDRVAASIPQFEPHDPLGQIETLTQLEVSLIQEILDMRVADDHVPPEYVHELRQIHRRGLAVRQACGDRALDAELGWLQGYGSFALMADLTTFDRVSFERDLAFRVSEVQRALELRRGRTR